MPGIETLNDTQADAWLSLLEIVFGETELLDPFGAPKTSEPLKPQVFRP